MANEITKITDQNGVEHPLVDVLGREATVDLLKDTTGWTGKNKAVFHGKGIYDLSTGVYTPLDPTNYGAWEKISCKGGEKFVFVCNNAINQVIWYEWNGNTFISATPHSDLTSSYDEYTVGSNTTLVACVARLTGGNITDDSDFGNPMIADAVTYALNPSYTPYHESVEDWYWDNNAKLGVHQYIDIDDITAKSGAVLTLNDTGFRCVVGTATSWCGAVYRRRCPVNTDFELKLDTAITSGITYISVKGSTDGTNYTSIKTSDVLTTSGSIDIAFNTGNYTYLQIEFFTTNASVTTCDVTITNLLLKLANDTSDAVTDFAMTNRELTEKVGNSGTYDLYMIANALTPANGAQPEFFIPWNNPELKTPTFSFTIRIRNNSAWETLAQSGNINIQKVCKNGFLVNASLTDALTSNSQYTFRIDGTITF